MAAAFTSISIALQLAEAELLRRAGFKVKNTFIEEEEEPPQAVLRRSATAPLLQLRLSKVQADDASEADLAEVGSECFTVADDAEHAAPAAKRAGSSASTATPSSSDPTESTPLPCLMSVDCVSSLASQPPCARGEVEPKLASLIKHECRFLQITSCTLVALAPRGSKRSASGGTTQCLRVCVSGLPALKRHKWQQPLAWSVASVLQRVGCPAIVRRGELFAPLTADDDSELVRVDLCAPRCGDVEE